MTTSRRWNRAVLAMAVLAAAALTTTTASAQLPKLPPMPSSMAYLLMIRGDAVQKELNMNADQKAAAEDAFGEFMSEAMGMFGAMQDIMEKPPAEQEKEMTAMTKTIDAKGKELRSKVDKLFDEKQITRSKELALQRRGADALEDEDLGKELKITDEQRKKLIEIRESTGDKRNELLAEAFTGGDPAGVQTKVNALVDEAAKKANEILNPEQRAAWDKLKGKKFEFPAEGGLFGL